MAWELSQTTALMFAWFWTFVTMHPRSHWRTPFAKAWCLVTDESSVTVQVRHASLALAWHPFLDHL